jgi:hypothetical protein
LLLAFSHLGSIELRSLENLDLSDGNRLKRENVSGVLFNFLVVVFADEVLGELSDVELRGFSSDEVIDFSSDGFNLRGLGISSSLDVLLAMGSLGECQSEDSNNVAIVSLAVDSRFNESLPLADHRAESITSNV